MPLDKGQRSEFRLSVAARETPRALAVVAGVFVAITAINAMFGPTMKLSTILINGFVALVLLAGAVITHQGWLPAWTTPWFAAVAALAMVTAGQVQVWVTPDGSAFAYVLLIVVAYSPLTLAWAPALAVAVPMFTGCVIVSRQWPDTEATDWVIASIAAIAIGLVLLGLRLRGIDETGELTETVETMATRDQLTGLLNRHGILQLVPGLTARARRGEQPVFAMFVDIVGMKRANDSLGHDAGDHLLTEVADALAATVRGDDVLGRWGGDEFLVLGVGDPQGPDVFAQRVRQSLERRAEAERGWPIEVSVGCSVTDGKQWEIDALIERADHDMYARRWIGRA